jgi:hypothetical protein
MLFNLTWKPNEILQTCYRQNAELLNCKACSTHKQPITVCELETQICTRQESTLYLNKYARSRLFTVWSFADNIVLTLSVANGLYFTLTIMNETGENYSFIFIR